MIILDTFHKNLFPVYSQVEKHYNRTVKIMSGEYDTRKDRFINKGEVFTITSNDSIEDFDDYLEKAKKFYIPLYTNTEQTFLGKHIYAYCNRSENKYNPIVQSILENNMDILTNDELHEYKYRIEQDNKGICKLIKED